MKMPGGGPLNVGSGQLTDDSEMAMCLMWGLIDSNKKFELLYRASRDGFKADNFHSKCDNQGQTLSLIKSKKQKIF